LIAQRRAREASHRWGLWTPPIQLKPDALRPVDWVLARNPTYRGRIVRKGDLRCRILEALRRDAGGRAHSESELARLVGAARTAVRKALRALVQEGAVVIEPRASNDRDHAVVLRSAAQGRTRRGGSKLPTIPPIGDPPPPGSPFMSATRSITARGAWPRECST